MIDGKKDINKEKRVKLNQNNPKRATTTTTNYYYYYQPIRLGSGEIKILQIYTRFEDKTKQNKTKQNKTTLKEKKKRKPRRIIIEKEIHRIVCIKNCLLFFFPFLSFPFLITQYSQKKNLCLPLFILYTKE